MIKGKCYTVIHEINKINKYELISMYSFTNVIDVCDYLEGISSVSRAKIVTTLMDKDCPSVVRFPSWLIEYSFFVVTSDIVEYE